MINLNNLGRLFLIFLLVWIFLEGVIRKWGMPEQAAILFLGKWMFALVLYLIFYFFCNRLQLSFRYPYQIFIFMYFVWCVLTVLITPHSNPWVVHLIGFFVHFIFLPLIGVVKDYFYNENQLERAMKIIAWISIPIMILSIFQFYLPTDHILNKFVNEEQLITRTGLGYTRTTSIFPFVKIYNVFLLYLTTIIIAYIFINLMKRKNIWLYFVVLLLAVINTFMSGSRLPMGLTGIYFVLIIGFVFINYIRMRKTTILLLLASPLVFLVLYNTTTVFKNAFDSFFVRVERAQARQKDDSNISDIVIRTEGRLDIFKYSSLAGLSGYGLGTTYQGNSSRLKTIIPVYYEDEGERLILEIGIVGSLIVILMRLFIFIHSINIILKCNNPMLKIILFSLTIYQIPHILVLSNTIYNYLDNFVYWFNFAIIIAISKFNDV